MISYLEGEVLSKKENAIILKTNNGIGFSVFLSKKSLETISPSKRVSLYSFLDIGERSVSLYGFLTEGELELFSFIKKISGIGGKASLEISSFGSLEKLREEIEKKGYDIFKGIAGLGEKRAKKIILEVSGQIRNKKNKKDFSKDEVFLALKKLGFSKEEIVNALEDVSSEGSSQERLRSALKILGGKIN